MKIVITALIVVLLFTTCKEQKDDSAATSNARVAGNETEKNIYRSGDSMLAAFKRRDWITFVRYNHPNMTKRMGGAEAFASFIDMQMKQIPAGSIKDIGLGKVLQVVNTAKDKQCVVEQNLEMEVKGSRLNKITYLIGESIDNGNTWTFFDASTKAGVLPKDIKPDLSEDLKIPAARNDIN
ncbi:MAG: hypothetical protein JWR18_2463 [Segetibacter sp.]|jgi:hypothetical protein|nr:hypothetical protein [Segetibacter sp.]